jgi:C4-dicarboxylate-specific signal transduction histidine kinase
VIDSHPRTFTKEKKEALTTLAQMVMSQMDLNKRNRELKSALIQLEEQNLYLFEISKMSALGEMAGGIAHEINNPLSIISGFASVLEIQIKREQNHPPSEKVAATLKGIVKGVERISGIIKGLQTFSRDSSNDPLQVFDLREVIRDSLDLCQESLRTQGIQILYEAPAEAISSACRPSQVAQILVNLLNNAKDATKALSGPKWIEIKLEQTASSVLVSVRDSGPGVPLELQEKIFRPFFTTKETGHGTGLGLSISSSIAVTNRAHLSLVPGEGSSQFVLRFESLA